ncbi:MAG TPA: TolC family protein [Planctomycetota bacterium]|nr:TolC family protein [Planctomycetota bacterium]
MQHVPALSRLLATAFLAAGCGSYEPRPLVEEAIYRDLQAIRLEALRPAAAEETSTAPPAFDASDGLSADEAIAVALFLNPDLRAFRKERGVAEGELITAGLLPNPELQVTWLHVEHFTKSLATSGFDVALSWAPPRPGELGAKQAQAQARIDEVKAQIAGEEWRLAVTVRETYAALLAAEEQLRLAESSLRLQERIRQFIRDKRQLGDANSLDVNLVDIELTAIVREELTVRNVRDRTRLELNRLLGLPPLSEPRLQVAGDPLAYSPFRLDLPALERAFIAHRPDLLALKQKYEQAEQRLRLAYIQRWPWFRFGPAYAQDEINGEAGNRWGLGLGIDLPLANLNQGEIARLEAEREKLRESFAARLHEARSEVHEAYRNLEAQARLMLLFEESIRPALEENVRLTEAGFQAGELNLLQVITTQDKALQSRREGLQTRFDYWKAVYELERALGIRLRDLQEEKGSAP